LSEWQCRGDTPLREIARFLSNAAQTAGKEEGWQTGRIQSFAQSGAHQSKLPVTASSPIKTPPLAAKKIRGKKTAENSKNFSSSSQVKRKSTPLKKSEMAD